MSNAAEVWPLTVDSGGDGETAELRIRGRLGLTGAAELDSVLDGIIARGGRTLLLDLSGVDYISSPGLRLLDDRARQLEEQGGTLSLHLVTDPVRLALDLAGLERLYQSHASGEPSWDRGSFALNTPAGPSATGDRDRSPEDQLQDDRHQRAVHECIAELPEVYQSALRLHYWLGTSMSDIGAMLDAPENTVKSDLHRARQLLHTMLAERGFDAR